MASSMGFTGWLTLLFIALKLTGYIDWSWWWVFVCFWAPLVIAVFGVIVAFLWSLENSMKKENKHD
jgi:uncharacterized membrane protein YhdT